MSSLNNSDNHKINFVNLTSDDWKCNKCESLVTRIWRLNQEFYNNCNNNDQPKPNFKYKCHHQFCKSCVDQLIVNVKLIKCPLDLIVTQKKEWIEDRLNSESLLDQQVFCSQKENGCRKIITLRNLKAHQKACLYRLVNCPLQCGEIVTIKSLSKHMTTNCLFRSTNCIHCNQEMSYQHKKNHEMKCPKKFSNCDFCFKKFPSKQLEGHFKDCPAKPKDCRLSFIGCSFQGNKEEVESHEKNLDGHFGLIVNHLIRDDNYPVDLKTQFGELMIMVKQLNEENDYLKKCLKKFKNEIDQLKSENKMMNEKISNVKLNHQIEVDSLRRDHDIIRNELKSLSESLLEERQV